MLMAMQIEMMTMTEPSSFETVMVPEKVFERKVFKKMRPASKNRFYCPQKMQTHAN